MKSFTDDGLKLIDDLILELSDANHYTDANAATFRLFDYKISTAKQVNDIAKLFLDNPQVHGSWTAGPLCRDLFRLKFDMIQPEYQKDIRRLLDKS